jgi:hypothetical protein
MSVSGGWCRFCEQQCFVERVVPGGSHEGWRGFMATCTAGRAYDRQWLGGYDASTSITPTATEPASLLQREISWQGAPRLHKQQPDREDELLRGMGELVRQIRKLAKAEVAMREALTGIASHRCSTPSACEVGVHLNCPTCIAARTLDQVSALTTPATSWEKC